MKKKILSIMVLIVSLFTLNVNAKQLYTEEKINITEQQDYSILALGTEINVSSFIDGASFIAGEDVNISSSQDIMFVLGEEIKIKDAYTKDAFLLGKDIEINNSQIKDLYAFAEEIEINSPISHNANLAGSKIVINSEIMGDVNIAAEEIIVTDKAVIHGTLSYPEYSYARISKEAKIEKEETYKQRQETPAQMMRMQTENFTLSFLSLAIVALVIYWLFAKQFDNLDKEKFTAKNIASKTALGFAMLIGIPIAICIAMISIIGLPLALIMLVAYIILIYLSIIPSGYVLGNKLFKDKFKKKEIILVLGILIIKLLELIPIIGGFVVFISLCYGLWMLLPIKKK